MSSAFVHGSSNRAKVSFDGTVVEVVKGTKDMPLHRELAYVPWSPDIIWFHCKVPARKDGETTFCDGVRFAESLRPFALEAFLKKNIRYVHNWEPNHWKGFLQTDTIQSAVQELSRFRQVRILDTQNECLRFDYETSAIVDVNGRPAFLNSIANMKEPRLKGFCEVIFEDGSGIPEDLLSEIHAAGTRCTDQLAWQPGDIILADNNRVMHGRRAFEGTRTIHTRFGKAA